MTDLASIPDDLKELPRWVVYRLRPKRGGSGRPDKIPLDVRGGHARSNDPATWSTFDEAVEAMRLLPADGVGFMFDSDADDVIGIDLDECVRQDGVDPWAVEVAQVFSTYTEISPSGTGLHLFVRGVLPDCSRKRGKVEMYGKGRFFTVTGRTVGAASRVESNQAAIDWLAREYLDAAKRDKRQAEIKRRPTPRIHADDRDVARSLVPLLADARADDYAEWIRVGLALKSIGDDMFLEWDDFSRRCPAKYDGEVVRRRWDSFKPRRANAAWLVAMARDDAGVERVSEALSAHVEPERARVVARIQPDHDFGGEVEGVQIEATRLHEVEPGRVEWLWETYVPRGMVSMLVGHPGVGKSTMLLDIAARMSVGRGWPDGTPMDGPMRVGLGMVEDDLRRVTVPRLLAAGAALGNVVAMGGKPTSVGEMAVRLPADAMRLEAFIRLHRLAMLVLDPITAYMGDRDSNAQQEVRDSIQPLSGVAERTNCAILLSNHTSKAWKERDAAFVGQGSIAFTAVARTQLLLVREPGEGEARVLWVTKSNVGPDLSVGGLAFRPTIPPGARVPTCRWDEHRYPDSLDEFLRRHRRGGEERESKADQAFDVIQSHLRRVGEATTDELIEECRSAGIGVSKAKQAMRQGMGGGAWGIRKADRRNANVYFWPPLGLAEQLDAR